MLWSKTALETFLLNFYVQNVLSTRFIKCWCFAKIVFSRYTISIDFLLVVIFIYKVHNIFDKFHRNHKLFNIQVRNDCINQIEKNIKRHITAIGASLDNLTQTRCLHACPPPPGIYQCHDTGGNQEWTLTKRGHIKHYDLCLTAVHFAKGSAVVMRRCDDDSENQLWKLRDGGLLQHTKMNACLDTRHVQERGGITAERCNSGLDTQLWRFVETQPAVT